MTLKRVNPSGPDATTVWKQPAVWASPPIERSLFSRAPAEESAPSTGRCDYYLAKMVAGPMDMPGCMAKDRETQQMV